MILDSYEKQQLLKRHTDIQIAKPANAQTHINISEDPTCKSEEACKFYID